MLKITNIHKKYKATEVLKGVDIKVGKGDVVVILGPSGSGKTTLLRCLNFLEHADQGEMEFGVDRLQLATASAREIAKVRKKRPLCFKITICFRTKRCWKMLQPGLFLAVD